MDYDDNDENGVLGGSKMTELVVGYNEALVLLDKLAYADGMPSGDIDILFLLREKNREIHDPK